MKEKSVLTDGEIETLVLSLGGSRGEEGFTEDEIMIVVRWAEEASIGYALLQNVLKGAVAVNVKDEEVVFDLTDRGRQEVEQDMLLHPNPQSNLLQ